MPSIFPFNTVTTTIKLRAELSGFLEISWDINCPALVAALNSIQIMFLKAVKVQALNLQATAHRMIMI